MTIRSKAGNGHPLLRAAGGASAVAAAVLILAPTTEAASLPAELDGQYAPDAVKKAPAAKPEAKNYGPKMIMEIGSIDFRPASDADYREAGTGGVQVASGTAFFSAPVHLPVGALIVNVKLFIDPNGQAEWLSVRRYSQLDGYLTPLGAKQSSAGTGPEAVSVNVNQVVKKGFSYRIATSGFEADGAIIHGARISYKLPK